MTFRLLLLICLTAMTTASSSADLIFSLRPVQLTSATTGFVDLVVESDSSVDFNSFLYGINISPVGTAPNGGLFFDTPVTDEASNPDFIFFGNSTLLPPTRLPLNQTILGGDFTASGGNVSLAATDGQRLVVRAELGFLPSLTFGDTFSIQLVEGGFGVNQATPSGAGSPVPFTLGAPVSFTFGDVAAVPEPSSVAVLLTIVGGAVYRRRRQRQR